MSKNTFKFSVIVCLAIILIGQSMNTNVIAHHPNYLHNVSIHSSSEYEWICANTDESSSWNHSDVMLALRNVLIYDSGNKWDDIANIYFAFKNHDQCSELPSSELSDMRMRVQVKDDTSSSSDCNGPYSCVHHYGFVGSHDGHNDYTYENIFLRSNDLTNVESYIINHEFGHALGLADGDGSCPGSIMHSADYGCSGYPTNPTNNDINSVTDISELQ